MEPTEEQLERARAVEDFVAGRMSDPDRSVFEEMLKADGELHAAVQAEQFLHAAQGSEHLAKFRSVLTEVAASVEARERVGQGKVISIDRKPQRNLYWAAAAMLAVVVTAGIWYFETSAPNERQLAMSYAQATVPHKRGGADAPPYSGVAELDRALELILEKRPDDALAVLRMYDPVDESTRCKHDWLQALALVQKQSAEEAMPLLDKVIKAKCYPEETHAAALRSEL
jgi:hypothetical protein